MSTKPSSLVGALQDAAGDNLGANRFMPEPEQMDLLRNDKGHLPADTLRQLRQRRGRGRPPGARNRRSDEVAKYFIHKYGDPLDALGEIINTDVDLLYEQMILAQGGEDRKRKRVTGKDALAFRLSAIAEVMPYIHQKRPMALEVNGKADAVIFIPGLNAPLGFTQEQLTQAVEALGAGAIEAAGIRLADGNLIEAATAPDEAGAADA